MSRRRNFSLPVAARTGEGDLRLRERILEAIAEMARQLGRTPSLAEFAGRSEISKHHVIRIFSKWNEAVRAAGLQPGRLYKRLALDELLEDWGKAVRKRGGLPSRMWYQANGEHYPRTFKERFGAWEAVPAAFRKFAEGRPEWSDVVVLVERAMRQRRSCSQASRTASPLSPPRRGSAAGGRKWGTQQSFSERSQGFGDRGVLDREIPGARRGGANLRDALHIPLKGRAIYGEPMNFRGMRHEPVNEQGVVLLFGMMAEELGYAVEAVQAGFPDCEAKRRVGTGAWQRVHIEFEFESRNFLLHGHPWRGCDVIVCWRHNWEDCPKQIEVVELSEVVRS